jgi:hypothetical protein
MTKLNHKRSVFYLEQAEYPAKRHLSECTPSLQGDQKAYEEQAKKELP